MPSYWTRKFWDRVGQIRSTFNQSRNFHAARTEAIERAVAEIYSEMCEPWFSDEANFERQL